MPDLALARPLTRTQEFTKRTIDLVVGLLGSIVAAPIITFAFIIASIETRRSGFYIQRRIGRHGRDFPLIKIRTMRSGSEEGGSWTVAGDARITRSGAIIRRLKIDELPQFFNVLAGHMSLVGPRPDVPGFADRLSGEDRLVLSVRPGITGPATLVYRNEEELLAHQASPEEYNRMVLFPEKVRINVEYVKHYSLIRDLDILLRTITATLRRSTE